MEDDKRLEAFEKMLSEIQKMCVDAEEKMKHLKAEGKEKAEKLQELFLKS